MAITTINDSDISYSIFDTHCTNAHPTILIEYETIIDKINKNGTVNILKTTEKYEYDDHEPIHTYKERTIMSFETLEEIYLKMKEEIKKGNWCLCSRIQEVKNE